MIRTSFTVKDEDEPADTGNRSGMDNLPGTHEQVEAGALYIVSTPIGNLGDISVRAAHILAGVSLIAAEDTRTTGILLSHLGLAKPMVSFFSHNEQRRVPDLLRRLKGGESVALVSDAGTPGISDPAFALIQQAVAAGIPIHPVPGPSAVLSALVVSGLPPDRFVFEGFLPVKKGRKTRWERLREEERTIVLYESPHRLLKTLEELTEFLGDRRIAVARELTKKFEEVIRGKASQVLSQLHQKPLRGEFVIVIGGTGLREAGGQEHPDDHNPPSVP